MAMGEDAHEGKALHTAIESADEFLKRKGVSGFPNERGLLVMKM
jgi:hypothetical protein